MFSIRSLYTAAAICMALFSLQVSADDNANNQLYCSSINTAGTNASKSSWTYRPCSDPLVAVTRKADSNRRLFHLSIKRVVLRLLFRICLCRGPVQQLLVLELHPSHDSLNQ